MRVLVTGGTGFVGAHAVAAIQRSGHDVRMFVRNRDRIQPALEPLGASVDDVVEGDVTHEAGVQAALSGCDAVVHVASVYSLDPRDGARIRKTNVAGTERVLRLSHERGLDPIIHISSIGALLPVRGGVVRPDDEPGKGVGVYTASKAESERVARRFQAGGAPVVTILPGGVWGPHDPHNGESNQIATNLLKGRQRLLTARGGFPIVDVRDVATAIAAAIEPGRGPRRYLVAGHVVSSAQLSRELSRLTGRKRRFATIPPMVARSPGAVVNLVQRVAPFRLPLSNEMLQVGTQPLQSVDDSRANEELGYVARPLEETLRDTVRSLYENGHISAKEAGLVAEA